MTEPYFGRLIPAMVSPFDEDLNLDLNRAQELAVRLADGGCDSIAVCATTGESPTIFYPQKLELFKAVISAVGERTKVVAYVGDNCTADTVAFAKDVAPLGVDGFLTVVPYYNKPPQEGIYRHFRTIAEAVPDVPMIMYNIPGRTSINMTAETTLRLAHDVDNIIAIKEASSITEQIATIAKEAPSDFSVYSGNDDETLEIMDMGGVGVVSTTANLAPARMREMIDLYTAGKRDEAYAALDALRPLMRELFITANPIMVKAALDIAGFSVGGLRLPLIDANDEQRAELAEVMAQVGDIR